MGRQSNKKIVYLRPQKKTSFLKILFIALFFILVIVLIFYHYISTRTYIVVNGTINESFFTDGVIIKNETLVFSPVSGKIQFVVNSGERVRVGTPIFIVTTDEKQKELYVKEIDEIVEKIEALQNDGESSSLSLSVINKSIESTTSKIKEATESGEFDKVKTFNDELSRLTKEKQKILESNEKNISLLKENIKELQTKLSEIDVIVHAPVAGIISFSIDGLEELLVADKVNELTYTQLQGIEEDKNNKSIPAQTKANQPVAKIIDNFSWYIALKLEKPMEEGKSYFVKFEDSEEKIKAKLTSIQSDGPIGLFLVNRDLKGLLDSRNVDLEVIVDTYSGCVIPSMALFDKEGMKGVYIIEQGKRFFKQVDIVAQNENEIVVNGIKPGDSILLRSRGEASWIH